MYKKRKYLFVLYIVVVVVVDGKVAVAVANCRRHHHHRRRRGFVASRVSELCFFMQFRPSITHEFKKKNNNKKNLFDKSSNVMNHTPQHITRKWLLNKKNQTK